MDQQALTNLAILLALGAGFVAPVKACVDLVKTAAPALPSWALLLTALLCGEAIVGLVAVYGGLDPTPAHLAGVVLGGAVAAGGAVASTELHRAARPETVADPTLVTSLADELEKRRDERVQARLHAVAEPALVSQPPHWLPPATGASATPTPTPARDPLDGV
jgi:hypothetical protein